MDSDNVHVQQALIGDTTSFDELTKKYLPDVYRYILWLTHDSDTASDVTQEAFVRAWQKLKKFDTAKTFKPWLLRIARNCAYDHLRRKIIIPFSHLSDAEEHYVTQTADAAPRPAAITQNLEQAERVQEVLDNLPIKYREVLILHYLEDLTTPEIANVLNLNYETIRTRLRRARALFRENYTTQNDAVVPLPDLTPQPYIAK